MRKAKRTHFGREKVRYCCVQISVNISASTTKPFHVTSPGKKRQRLHAKEEPDSTTDGCKQYEIDSCATSEKAGIAVLRRNRTHISEIRVTRAIPAVLAVKYVTQVAESYGSFVHNHQNSHSTPNAQNIQNVESAQNMESRQLAEKEENEEQETIEWLLEMSRGTL